MPEAFFPILVAAQGGVLVPVLIAVFVTLIVTAIVAIIVSLKVLVPLRMKEYEAEVGSAEQRSKEIIDDANRSAQKIAATAKKEALLEAKEEALRAKNESDREIKERRAEVQRYEKRVTQKEENLDRKLESLEKKEARMTQKEQDLDRKIEEANEYCEKQIAELERISGLTSDKAKEYLLESVKEDVKHETAVMIRDLETEARETADKRAKELIVNSIQKCAADHVAEATISVFHIIELLML